MVSVGLRSRRCRSKILAKGALRRFRLIGAENESDDDIQTCFRSDSCETKNDRLSQQLFLGEEGVIMSTRQRVVLHVGMGKTGTSSIQYFLWKNAAALRDRGWITVDPSVGERWSQTLSKDDRLLAAALDHVIKQAGEMNLIWSREAFSEPGFATPERVRRIAERFVDRDGECPIFCVSVIWSMLPERSKDDDDFERTAGRTAEGLQAA